MIAVVRLFSVVCTVILITLIMVENSEIEYNRFKQPMVEDNAPKTEPRPVYPPLKKKPYTRSTRVA